MKRAEDSFGRRPLTPRVERLALPAALVVRPVRIELASPFGLLLPGGPLLVGGLSATLSHFGPALGLLKHLCGFLLFALGRAASLLRRPQATIGLGAARAGFHAVALSLPVALALHVQRNDHDQRDHDSDDQ